jgi:hypothetical protein
MRWVLIAVGNFLGFATFAGSDMVVLKLVFAATTLGAVMCAARSYLR